MTTDQHEGQQPPLQRRCIWCGHREHDAAGCDACQPIDDEPTRTTEAAPAAQ